MDELYKCGYCGYLINSQCQNLLEHDCFKNVYIEGQHDLVEDDKKVLTIVRQNSNIVVGVRSPPEASGGSSVSLEERLINYIHQRPALYNIGLPLSERSNSKKNALWTEIANLFGNEIGVEELQKKWKYLRDSYVRSKKKLTQYKPSGSAATGPPDITFKYFELMRFMDDGIASQTTVCSVSPGPSRAVTPSPASTHGTTEETTSSEQTPVTTPLTSPVFSNITPRATLTAKRKKNDGKKDVEKGILEALSAPSTLDGVDGFLLRLGESLRKLPYRERSQLELNIMQLVLETEARLGID